MPLRLVSPIYEHDTKIDQWLITHSNTALEDCPPLARGIISGMLQQGYAFGYLLATVFARAFVNTVGHSWRPLFWFGAGPPVLIIVFRLCLPETNAYIERQKVRDQTPNAAKLFIEEGKVAMKRHWLVFCYLVLLMAGKSSYIIPALAI
jgi:SHS family lactate transporter-like MFS transporter